jgi:hypothetical protein
MLLFMPWCPIDQRYEIGDVEIIPFERDTAIGGLDDDGTRRVNQILASYKTIEGNPVPRAALVYHRNKSVIDDLANDEIDLSYDLVTLACFSALSGREYFNPIGRYCNSESFTMYVQKFEGADFTALTTRRRDGSALNAWPLDRIAIIVPLRCHPIHHVSIDSNLIGDYLINVRHRMMQNGAAGKMRFPVSIRPTQIPNPFDTRLNGSCYVTRLSSS